VVLEVENVAVRYGGAVLALEQVSLDVPAGGAVALLGANGAGKTTLLRAIGGLLGYHRGAIVRGDIRFDGRSTRRMDTARLVDQRAGLLSGGEQQMLAIGRALMAGPRLLVLDEPSLGLAPIVAAEIADALLRIRRQGTAILLADQSTALALRATEHAFLLENGRVRASGPTSELLLDDELRACYLGTAGGHDLVLEEVGG
jgi:branched-chain amino acid transport system ATP-binding protein